MPAFLRFAKSLALYVVIVAGGVTLFLIVAPIFGYVPYGDRPGPGWYGEFPALGWTEFWANAWGMLQYGSFLALLFVIPGTLGLLLIRGMQRVVSHQTAQRALTSLIAAVAAGWWMLGAGWYISAGWPLLVLSAFLGALAGAYVLALPPNQLKN
jgi:hypothetical protein